MFRTAAFTRYWDKTEALEFWLKYYSRFFDDLVVFGCNATAEADNLLKEYHATYIPLNFTLYHPSVYEAIFAKQKELLQDHRWVLYSDMDEIVVPDMRKYKDLKDYMIKENYEGESKQTYCEGFEIFQKEPELPIDLNKPILEQRHWWTKDESGSYSKPLLSQVPSPWREGFHTLDWYPDFTAKLVHDTGLYLFHLRTINQLAKPDRGGEPMLIPSYFKGAF